MKFAGLLESPLSCVIVMFSSGTTAPLNVVSAAKLLKLSV